MFTNIPIRLRLTIMTVTLLTVCCLGLTVILNVSANRMVEKVDVSPTTPAMNIKDANALQEQFQLPPSSHIPVTAIESSQEAKNVFRMESIIYVLLIIMIGGLFTYFISGRALKPLTQLNIQVKSIHANNLSDVLSVPHSGDEVAELTTSFNNMIRKLDDSFKMQQRFSTNAAHELRTPLTVLQTKIDVFKKSKTHAQNDYDALFLVMEKQTKRLRELVKNLLSMTNMEEMGDKSLVNLENMFEDIITELSQIAEDQQVNMRLRTDKSSVFGNFGLLHRAFYNLVENAILYNTKGGTVNIRVNRISKELVSIKIEDTGIGMSEQEKAYIFEPFYRINEISTKQATHAGLGLSIVDKIITAHDGKIVVTTKESNGTCFEIILHNSVGEEATRE